MKAFVCVPLVALFAFERVSVCNSASPSRLHQGFQVRRVSVGKVLPTMHQVAV